jgi:hypothetical protein
LQPIKFIEGGETRQVSTLEAILLQLWRKELLGDQRALKVRLQYQELAIRNSKPKLQLTFVDNDYTRSATQTYSFPEGCLGQPKGPSQT